MKAIIINLSKINLVAACAVACLFGIITNNAFNTTGAIFFNASSVNNVNNLIDVLQIVGYTFTRLAACGSLTRYDAPLLLVGATSLVC